VRRFANAACIADLLPGTRRDSVLDPFKPYLDQRYRDGCTDTTALLDEIRQQGIPRQRANPAPLPMPVPALHQQRHATPYQGT
jgi:hypothetical protein